MESLSRAAALRQRFFDGWMALYPEEASSLGISGAAHRLSDVSPRGAADEVALHEATLRALDGVDRGSLEPDLAIDLLLVERLCRFRRRELVERRAHLRHLEAAATPHLTIMYQRAQATSAADHAALQARAAELPAYLSGVRESLEEGLRAGLACDHAVAEAFVAHDLPRAASFCDLIDAPAAAAAYRELTVFVGDAIVPAARDAPVPGPERYAQGLLDDLGLTEGPATLVERAWQLLRETQAEAFAVASQLSGERVTTMEGVRSVSVASDAALVPTDADVGPMYQRLVYETAEFATSRGLLNIPDGGDLEIVAPISADVFPFGGGTNWPAPLLDRSRRGLFVVVPDRTLHPVVRAPTSAIHEAIPGHFMQSLWWQQTFGDDSAPVRFLLVPDACAAAAGWWPQMLNIEGWATYAEELMRGAGFYEGRAGAHVFALMCKAVRAVRVIVDVSLHMGWMSAAEGAHTLSVETAFGDAFGVGEVLRYRRIPGQAITYLLGHLQIDDLRDRWRELAGPEAPVAAFHDALFAAGPVPPTLLDPAALPSCGSKLAPRGSHR